jgi:CRP/FNR family transcriptional regulator
VPCATRHDEPRRNASSKRAPVSLVDVAAEIGAPVPREPQPAQLKFPVRQVRAGEFLHRAGDRSDAIYVVRAGFFKTVRVESNGTEQVMAFPMRGDAIGLDGLASGKCQTDAVALDASLVVAITHDGLGQFGRAWPGVERLVHFLYSREIGEQQLMMLRLGSSCADARVASFLLHLADKCGRYGYSRTALTLRMTRRDIGSHLGLKLETVSRCLSAFAGAGILGVDHRSLLLRDVDALRSVAAPPASVPRPLRPIVAAKRTWSRYEPLTAGAHHASCPPHREAGCQVLD